MPSVELVGTERDNDQYAVEDLLIADQPRLANSGLTADEHRRRLALLDPREGSIQGGQFLHPTYQYRGAQARAYELHHVPARDRAPEPPGRRTARSWPTEHARLAG